mmetsp:Transcript_14275/g.30999  ORF Transcript_14275/g.30999 Transcript_14275/m.30999 type:complete len:625 (-) Transcript_14275:98-1972(-)
MDRTDYQYSEPCTRASTMASRRPQPGSYGQVSAHDDEDLTDQPTEQTERQPSENDVEVDDNDTCGDNEHQQLENVGTTTSIRDAAHYEDPHPNRRCRTATALSLVCIAVVGTALAVALGGGSIVQSSATSTALFFNDHDVSYGPPQDWGKCHPATTKPSPITHAHPVEGSPVSRVAFASCFRPYLQVSDALWKHLREDFEPDLFIWLGDNMYLDTMSEMNDKRRAYNAAREDKYYLAYGPVAQPKIPTVAIWDDHDFGVDNAGREYPCLRSSQNEFVTHFNLPETDPRHPAQGGKQRFGVYSSHMFSVPEKEQENGIHLINLDNRSHRSPTFPMHGLCEGANSTMLGAAQWAWLEAEMLNKTSVIKLVSSGVQVLPPTSKDRPADEYCSYDGPDGSFVAANIDMEEDGADALGTKYEGWGEMPAERARLLRLAQRSINEGRAKQVVFLTGDQHWVEIQAKRMSESEKHGKSRILYSVTASGIDQHYIEDVANSNRVRVRSADTRGDGMFIEECNFPFVVDGRTYDDCVDIFGAGAPGCATRTSSNNIAVSGQWGNCLDAEKELVPRSKMAYGKGHKCTDQYHHTCSAQANYGGLVVDWDNGTMDITLFTPHEKEIVASSISIDM